MTHKTGTLYVVATPLGNLEDITLRAKRILAQVDLIVAEDTRHSKKLLQHLLISTRLLPLHAHNERKQADNVIDRLQRGSNIAMITDAGTPLISDPGHHLVYLAHQHNIPVVPVPGPAALIAALSVAGLPADKFYFAGFLSSKAGPRQKTLQQLQQCEATLVFYEAPHRIIDCIQDMKTIFGEDRYAVIARELTKLYETVQGGNLKALYDWLVANQEQQQGEFVLIVEGAVAAHRLEAEQQRILEILLAEFPNKQAVNLTAKITGAAKNQLYDLALKLKG